ncbi:hypothetical protein [Pseudomonas mosselii]|uniref:hypothetical protein n=1 Tax=Pseudomonas mosselii TaxID=78327 RepID=UPI000A0F93F1|nr:hypothetical protein [Pseudomonas mosselii]MDH1100418.1 hypothetical protein [Pseudomonas mosselii]MDH1658438.1 hypothetical protein [Pseudomonas mosselii]MDH1718264.1 hypothetical protein [Pseudomonas mosselii]MDH1723885.1 hypothetical protein [Pseudomonas mosselii]MDN4497329.1 hypothetical protein [Pseudomonas mosselii]
METRDVLALLTCVLLVVSGGTYGIKFLRKGNVLLGLEWLIVAFSGTNFLIYLLTQSQISYGISFFCDAFSRGFGIPIVTVLGLMAVTHNFRPSAGKDVLIFAITFAATLVMIKADFLAKPLPYFYVVMWAGYTVYLAYFISRLVMVGEYLHAFGVSVAAMLGLMVACIYDFFPIPGDDTKAVFMSIALASWSFMMIQLYYAFFALKRARHQALPVR